MNTPDTNYCDSMNPEERANEPKIVVTTASANTPDTEWLAESKIYDAFYMRDIDALTTAVIELKANLRSSRDTYWKERVRKEVEGMKEYGHCCESPEGVKCEYTLALDAVIEKIKTNGL